VQDIAKRCILCGIPLRDGADHIERDACYHLLENTHMSMYDKQRALMALVIRVRRNDIE